MHLSKTTVTLFFFWMLPSSGCGNGEAVWLGEPAVVSGQIDGWGLGAGYHLRAEIFSAEEFHTVAEAPIDAAGSFSIILPQGHAVEPYLTSAAPMNQPCKIWTSKVSREDVRSASVIFSAVNSSSGMIPIFRQSLPQAALPLSIAQYTYLDGDLSVVAESDCIVGTQRRQGHIEQTLKRGWNALHARVFENTDTKVKFEILTEELPDTVEWRCWDRTNQPGACEPR